MHNLQTVNVNKQWVLHNRHREFILNEYDRQLKVFDNDKPAWLIRLERTLCYTLDPRFKSHQSWFFFHMQVHSAAMLAVERTAGVAPEVNLRNLLCAGDETCKQEILSGFETPGQTSPEVQKRGMSGPTKRTYVLKKNSKKKFDNGIGERRKKSVALITCYFPGQGLSNRDVCHVFSGHADL